MVLSIVLPLKCDPQKRILLGSGGFGGRADTRAFFESEVDLFLGDVENVVLVPYAQLDCAALLAALKKRNLTQGRRIVSLAATRNPLAAIKTAQSFLVWGGNTFKLLKTVQDLGLLNAIRKKVEAGTPYIGVSAGTVLSCPTISTTNDMPVVSPKTLDALNLISFQINAHYTSGPFFYRPKNKIIRYMGETRDDRITEYLALNPKKKVLGIPEGTFLKIMKGHVSFRSHKSSQARLFQDGKKFSEFRT